MEHSSSRFDVATRRFGYSCGTFAFTALSLAVVAIRCARVSGRLAVAIQRSYAEYVVVPRANVAAVLPHLAWSVLAALPSVLRERVRNRRARVSAH